MRIRGNKLVRFLIQNELVPEEHERGVCVFFSPSYAKFLEETATEARIHYESVEFGGQRGMIFPDYDMDLLRHSGYSRRAWRRENGGPSAFRPEELL